MNDSTPGPVVLRKPVHAVQSHKGEFLHVDFSDVTTPCSYVIRAGEFRTS